LSYTDFVDDEKPLYVRIGAEDSVVGLGEGASGSPFATVGLYGMSPKVFSYENLARQMHMSRLRNFLGLLLESGLCIKGFRLSKAIDVDRPSDIVVAEEFLREQRVMPCR